VFEDILVERIENTWVFSDGTILPVVSGGSDTMGDGSGGNSDVVVTDVTDTTPAIDDSIESLAAGFLKNIPEEDLPYVEKHIKDWDAGVTKKFQEIHETYKPYKELGAAEELAQAKQIAHILETQPEYVLELLQAELGVKTPLTPEGGGNTLEIPKELEGLPEEFAQKWVEQQTLLDNLAQVVIKQNERVQTEQEDQQLNAEMKRLRDTHGDFDEKFVLARMWHGESGDSAVKAFNELKQGILNSQEKVRPQPPSLTGGGPLPADKKSVTEMDKKQVKDLMVNMLERAQQS
jgi:hypothetical protein